MDQIVTIDLESEVASALASFFQARADWPMPKPDSSLITWAKVMREIDLDTVAWFAGPGPYRCELGWLRRICRDLIGAGIERRIAAYHRPDFDHSRVSGGFITRMCLHDQSPEAEEYDRLALALVNGARELDYATRLSFVI